MPALLSLLAGGRERTMTHVPEIDVASAVDGLFVVETADGDAFVGELAFERDAVVIHNGFVGRPPVVPRQDVRSITPAAEHPDVVLQMLPVQR